VPSLACRVADPQRYGVVEFGADGEPRAIVEKPPSPPSPYAVTGLYFYDARAASVAASMKPSARGELEITDVNNHYLQRGQLRVEQLGRGFAWLDMGTPDSLLRASEFIEAVEQRQGLKIAVPEEIAWRMGFIDRSHFAQIAADARLGESYRGYLKSLLAEG
jgi:glucose-1-phosphate thymidylyltransferase